ncbi:MAG: uncharacterized protein H6R19_129 [Proteobacteria bacterium]|nr:uncharacterized protein [Pseudomonadota bacterium]
MKRVKCNFLDMNMPESISIRTASAADAECYASFLAGIFAEHLDTVCPPAHAGSAEQLRAHLLAPGQDNAVIFLAEQEGELLGALSLSGGTRPGLEHVARLGLSVKSAARECGIATALMHEALAWLAASPVIERIELEVMSNNAIAIRLYENCGFVHEDIRRQAVKKNGRYFDLYSMGLLKSEAGTTQVFCDCGMPF